MLDAHRGSVRLYFAELEKHGLVACVDLYGWDGLPSHMTELLEHPEWIAYLLDGMCKAQGCGASRHSRGRANPGLIACDERGLPGTGKPPAFCATQESESTERFA